MFARKKVQEFAPAMAGGGRCLDRAMDQPRRWRVHRRRGRNGEGHAGRASSAPSFRTASAPTPKTSASRWRRISIRSEKSARSIFSACPTLSRGSSRLRIRSTLRFFETEVERVISARRRILAERPDAAPNDLLTHLLQALRFRNRRRITEAELRSNILTFIAAGHETTANTLSWAMFLLSQSPEWRERDRGRGRP